jgi:hypothetical protein
MEDKMKTLVILMISFMGLLFSINIKAVEHEVEECTMKELIKEKMEIKKKILMNTDLSEEKAQEIIDKIMELKKRGMAMVASRFGLEEGATHEEILDKFLEEEIKCPMCRDMIKNIMKKILKIKCELLEELEKEYGVE